MTIEDMLNANIPPEAISKRPGASGKKLDYLEGWYVINRMNEIFGHSGWSYTAEILGSSGEARQVQVMAMVKVFVYTEGGGQIIRQDIGYGNGDMELAHKEAVTDALKRACRTLGSSLGNALYDKTKRGVGAPKETKATARDGVYPRLEKAIRATESLEDLYKLTGHEKFQEAFESLPQDWQPHLDECIANKEKELTG